MTSIQSHQVLSEQSIKVILRDSDKISEEVTNQYFASNPGCATDLRDRITDMCKVDLGHHLRFLVNALSVGAEEIFIDYARWLKDVLKSRNQSIEHPKGSFKTLKQSILSRVQESDKAIIIRVMDAGINALDDSVNYAILPVKNVNRLLDKHEDYTTALAVGNRGLAESIVKDKLKEGIGLIDVEVGIIQPAMYEIGNLWQQNKITVAQEHLATAISQNAIARAYALAEFADPLDKKVVCACVEGNHHGLGLRMVSDAFEISGWDSIFLGTDTPSASIIEMVDREKPDALAISISLPSQLLGLKNLVDQLHSNFQGKMPALLAGGQIINRHMSLFKKMQFDRYYIDAKSVQEDL